MVIFNFFHTEKMPFLVFIVSELDLRYVQYMLSATYSRIYSFPEGDNDLFLCSKFFFILRHRRVGAGGCLILY